MGQIRIRSKVIAGLIVVSMLTVACSDQTPAQSPVSGELALGVPGRANANVSLATLGMFAAVVWSASEPTGLTDVFASVSRDGGLTFSSPVRVNSEPGQVQVSGEQPPRVALSHQFDDVPAIEVIWTAKASLGTSLLVARSIDGGASFSTSQVVSGTDAAGNRGWESLVIADYGRAVAAWLDHRQLASHEGAMAGAHHHSDAGTSHEMDSVAMAQLSQLYFSSLDDDTPRALTGGVCYCCKTAIAAGQGTLAIAWRHVYPGDMRDIAFTYSRDNGRTFSAPIRVSEDRWSIAGCPDDGPSMAIDSTNRIHIVWPTVVNENGEPLKALFYSSSADGTAFTPRVPLPTIGHANHPQLALAPDGSLAVTWDEIRDSSRTIALARTTAGTSDRTAFVRDAAVEDVGVYPVVAFLADGHLLRAWTTGFPSSSVIRIARN